VTTVHLLGRPRVDHDGREAARPRGRKPWAVLAYLATAERPVTRERLAGLLFGEADDPLGALRWSLAEARRLVGVPDVMTGEALTLGRQLDGLVVDVQVVTTASWVEGERFALAGGHLLEGMSFPANPAFDAWLSSERHHLDAIQANVLREATLGRLAVGDAAGAATSARALVAHEPYDEAGHVLLVRAFVEMGEQAQAEAALEHCHALFAADLGHPPTDAVAGELAAVLRRRPSPDRAAARAALEAGAAAVAAGAVDIGLERLRDAAARSQDEDDLETEVAALCELGYALVHSVRGRDDAGAATLARAVAVADVAGRPELAVAAHRELGYVDFLAARYPEALRHLDQAEGLAADGGSEAAAVAAIRGACLTDVARYPEAAAELERAVGLARAAAARRWLVWAATMAGRLHLLRDEPALARPLLDEALEVSQEIAWTSVLPWPEALLAEVQLLEGDLAAAGEAAGHAFALGCELRDPCWEETAGRVLGRLALMRGEVEQARTTLLDAAARGARGTDGWRFAHAEVLDALAALAPRYPTQGEAWINDLELVAGAGGMRELLVRAHLHRAALGQVGARAAAAELADGIDNPALTRWLTRATEKVASHPNPKE
jgi:DNA-binding SARP family transcriptional activator